MFRCGYFFSEVIDVEQKLKNSVEVAGYLVEGVLLPMFLSPAGRVLLEVRAFLSQSR